MRAYIAQLGEKVLSGGSVSYEEALVLEKVKGADLSFLMAYACKIREINCGNNVDLCSIVSARTGGCSENCAFCAQSARYSTGVESKVKLDEEEILAQAKATQDSGAHHFDIVTSGRGYNLKNPEFQRILKIFERLRKEISIELCACLGVIGEAEALALKEAGVTRYNHNLEAAESYFDKIVTTHTYREREETIQAVKMAGLEVCSGGIIGLGEAFGQRVELAITLGRLQVDTVPINILNPIPGTPLEGQERLKPLEILKSLAMFRFLLPGQTLRFAGGREAGLRSLQPLGFFAGLNGMLVGNYLTTEGQGVRNDLRMLEDLELVY